MEDFVKCLFCQKENVKQDEFLDLPLAVKQFGASDAFKSVVSFLYLYCLATHFQLIVVSLNRVS